MKTLSRLHTHFVFAWSYLYDHNAVAKDPEVIRIHTEVDVCGTENIELKRLSVSDIEELL